MLARADEEPRERESLLRLLLTHHSRKSIHHTLLITVAGRHLRLCSRCTGLAVGFAFGIGSLTSLLGIFASFPFLIPILPLAGAIDWLLQVFGVRESTNLRRVVTAIPIGVLYPTAGASLIGGYIALLGYFVVFWAGYLGVLYILFRTTGALDRYIRSTW